MSRHGRQAIVPADFAVPTGLTAPGFRLEPLGLEHNERDHRAWMSSVDHIRATPGFAGLDWPQPMSLEQNAADLSAHAQDFADRTGFTYTVLDAEEDVVGCVYLYPDKDDEDTVVARSWVRADRAELDEPLWRAVSVWLAREWPFARVRYAARS